MKINFNLATPKNKVSSIRMVVTHKGKVYRKAVGLSCPVKDWSSSRQRCGHPAIDRRLKEIFLYIESHTDETSNGDAVSEAIEMALMDEKERNDYLYREKHIPTFWERFFEWCDRKKPTRSAYRLVARLMGTDANWDDITVEWYNTLVSRVEDCGYSQNYVGFIRQHLKSVMIRGLDDGYHRNMSYKKFGRGYCDVYAVYLTKEEVDNLWEANFEYDYLNKVRDLFLLGVYTAARVSDYSRITLDNIRDGFIEFYQQKTKNGVTIPCSPRVRAILERNGGTAPQINYCCYLRRLKDVCKGIGMTQVVQVPDLVRKKLHKAPNEPVFKYELVTSHTARRTGATLLYMTGVPITQCRMITGHRTETSFLKYIRVTKEENARLLADNPFFK